MFWTIVGFLFFAGVILTACIGASGGVFAGIVSFVILIYIFKMNAS